MTCYQEISCPTCGGHSIMKSGRNTRGVQRYRCQHQDCVTKTFMLEYYYKAYEPGINEQIVEMAINSSGIRDTAHVLNINKNTVIRTLKKQNSIVQVNPLFLTVNTSVALVVRLEWVCEKTELDEQRRWIEYQMLA